MLAFRSRSSLHDVYIADKLALFTCTKSLGHCYLVDITQVCCNTSKQLLSSPLKFTSYLPSIARLLVISRYPRVQHLRLFPITMDNSIRQPRKWSLAEDQKLREEVEAQRKLHLLQETPPMSYSMLRSYATVSAYQSSRSKLTKHHQSWKEKSRIGMLLLLYSSPQLTVPVGAESPIASLVERTKTAENGGTTQ